jgi:PAS domain-containing protein
MISPTETSQTHQEILKLREELIVARSRVESAPVAIYHTNACGQIIYANPEYRRFLKLGPEESLDN